MHAIQRQRRHRQLPHSFRGHGLAPALPPGAALLRAAARRPRPAVAAPRACSRACSGARWWVVVVLVSVMVFVLFMKSISNLKIIGVAVVMQVPFTCRTRRRTPGRGVGRHLLVRRAHWPAVHAQARHRAALRQRPALPLLLLHAPQERHLRAAVRACNAHAPCVFCRASTGARPRMLAGLVHTHARTHTLRSVAAWLTLGVRMAYDDTPGTFTTVPASFQRLVSSAACMRACEWCHWLHMRV